MKATAKNWLRRSASWAKAHKIWTGIIVIVLAFIGYRAYASYAASSVAPQYVVAIAHRGNIVQTVTGSGQVSAENQLDVTSQVSGQVTSIAVKIGDHVAKGQLLATIDPHDAQISLQNAQIAYDKLTAPPKTTDLSTSENNLLKSYNDAFNSAAGSFTDLQSIMAGLNSMLYSQGGFLSEAYAIRLNSTSRPLRDQAGKTFDAAAKQYIVVLQEYQGLSRASDRASLDGLFTDTADLLKSVSQSLQEAQAAVNFIQINQPEYYPHDVSSAVSNLNTWLTSTNSDLSSVVSAQNSVATNGNSLATLVQGADALDVESQRISLQQSQENYAKYFIRAPFDGIVGRIPTSVYAQAGASTVVATVVGDQKIATISLNEVDAAKVTADQPVSITFDAIDGLTATGTVMQVDQVGTVSQGVVSYGVKIAINTQDPRIKPGMSLNTTITTMEKDGVLVVPSAAVKAQGNQSYVQTLDQSVLQANMQASGRAASTTRSRTASSTGQSGQYRNASSTRGAFAGSFGGPATLTISTAVALARTNVTVGDSDGTNTEITGGLTPGQAVVVRTTTSSAAQTTATPTLFSSIGGNRGGAAGGARAGTFTR